MASPDTAGAWEALFWTVFKRSRNPMSLVDEEGRYVEVNPVHREVFGRSPEELIGTRIEDNLPPSELVTLDAEKERFARTGQYSGERRYVRGDGSVVRVQYAACMKTLGGRSLALYVSHVVQPEDDEEPETPAVVHNGNGLSPREREVVRHVAMGMTSRQIAEELTVSTETVRTHIRNALAKTGTRTRAQLVAQVMGTGMLAD